MKINSCTLELSLFYYDLTYQKNGTLYSTPFLAKILGLLSGAFIILIGPGASY